MYCCDLAAIKFRYKLSENGTIKKEENGEAGKWSAEPSLGAGEGLFDRYFKGIEHTY